VHLLRADHALGLLCVLIHRVRKSCFGEAKPPRLPVRANLPKRPLPNRSLSQLACRSSPVSASGAAGSCVRSEVVGGGQVTTGGGLVGRSQHVLVGGGQITTCVGGWWAGHNMCWWVVGRSQHVLVGGGWWQTEMH